MTPAELSIENENAALRERLETARTYFRQQREALHRKQTAYEALLSDFMDLQAQLAIARARQQNTVQVSTDAPRLQEELRAAQAESAQLREDLKQAQRDVAQAQRERDYARWERDHAQRSEQIWRGIASIRTQPPTSPADVDGELKKLLVLAHPDKWSQGQPATALAHEIVVVLNTLRGKLEVRA